MKIHQIPLLTLIYALALISGCSSGGDDSSAPTDPNTVFQLYNADTFKPGYTVTLTLTGTDTGGGKHTGSMSSSTQPTSTFLGQTAIPIIVQLQLTNTVTGAFASNIGTGYYSTIPTDRHYIGYTDSTRTTVSAVTSAIPQTAKIGDFGNIGTYTYNTGDVQAQSWRLDNGGNGLADFVVLSSFRDQFSSLLTSTTTTATIDTSGKSISAQIILYDAASGITLTLNGS